MDAKDIKFSVVLPCYNVEKYIAECLDSLVNQTYPNLEIICVNDGSTDGTLQVIESYIAKDSRIQVVTQHNQGLGQTRTNGMQYATGDYIAFFDPDDWVELNTFEKLAEYINQHEPTVVRFEYRLYFEETQSYENIDIARRSVKRIGIDLTKVDSYSWQEMKNVLIHGKSSACDKVYKLSFLRENDLKFPAHRYGEDVAFYRELLFTVDRIHLCHECFYNYRRHSKSLSNAKVKLDKTFLLEQIAMTERILEKHNLMERLQKEFVRYKLRFIYELEKGTDAEFKQQFMSEAKKYLSKCEYMQLLSRIYFNAFVRSIFKIETKYQSTAKTQVTLFGFKFVI